MFDTDLDEEDLDDEEREHDPFCILPADHDGNCDVHVTWCGGTGEHNPDHNGGECMVRVVVQVDCQYSGDEVELRLLAIPCDSAYVEVPDMAVHDVDSLDRLVAGLASLREVLASARADADCDLHPHVHG